MQTAGHIFQINASDGGVPKRGVTTAVVDKLGLEGDKQADKTHHGGPQRALCLYSLERILALQAEGHPIYPGSTGENLTIAGLDWAQVLPGARLRLGNDVTVTITSYAAPCRTIRASFQEEQFKRISQKTHPGWARAYACVERGGALRIGDPVILEAADGR